MLRWTDSLKMRIEWKAGSPGINKKLISNKRWFIVNFPFYKFWTEGSKDQWRNYYYYSFIDPLNLEEGRKILQHFGSKFVKRKVSDKSSFIRNHVFIYPFHSILSFIIIKIMKKFLIFNNSVCSYYRTNYYIFLSLLPCSKFNSESHLIINP